jgi:hypothetical protein
MTMPSSPEELNTKLSTFFKMVFGLEQGYVNVAYGTRKTWKEFTFHMPTELPNLIHNIIQNSPTANSYFCPQLLLSKSVPPGQRSTRFKENVQSCPSLWADLDSCSPDLMLVEPSITIESSPGRYQAYWAARDALEPKQAEAICKAIAYHHVPDGADSSGWDLTQLMRIPYTHNLKYDDAPGIVALKSNRLRYNPEDFEQYINSRRNKAVSNSDPMPEMLPTEAPLDIMQRYRRSLNPITFSIFSEQPGIEADWSKLLWQLIMLCYEAGMDKEEVFVIASGSACNKYKRDGKHPRLLWNDVCRGYTDTLEKLNVLIPKSETPSSLITEAELRSIDGYDTFIERYVKWATSLGDAAEQYHHATAFMTLSSIVSGAIRLPTSFGTIMPNLWFMILADTTLTRKTTAMDVGMDLVDEVDQDILLATDGSLEGLMQALEARPGKPSVFLRDEFSGLIEAMTKKDYLAGFAEALTKLYDGKTMKRVLKRETVTIREPCLLIFAGGIKTRVQAMLTLDHVASGFVPRFLFVTAESDVSKLRPLGPPTMQNLEDRAKLVEELLTLKDRYVQTTEIKRNGTTIGFNAVRHDAQLTEAAWQRYNRLESALLYAGVQSDQPDIMTPVYDRLAKSTLKAAVLIAASRMQHVDVIRVELEDLLLALKYSTRWRDYAVEIVNGIGRSASEQEMQRIYLSITRHPGIARSQIMQWYHLEARRADIIFATLEQRGLIAGVRMGKTMTYTALGRMS